MNPLSQARRIVVKLGTGVLTSGIGELDTGRVDNLCASLAALRRRGTEVVLVSSGAVGLGMGRLGLRARPGKLASLQACAAVGQSILINTWQKGFDPHGLTVAQVLLTREDLRSRHRHNAVFNTMEQLLAKGTVPVINENDTVSAAEIKFGDNDTLSALVASVINADLLFILSNIPGLIDQRRTGEIVRRIETITPDIEAMARGTTQTTSVGGMVSKLSAARIAQRAGCGVFIASGRDDTLFDRLLAGDTPGTYFVPSPDPVKSHKRWIAIQDHVDGRVRIDEGAAAALQTAGKSLLLAGIVAVEGDFEPGDLVQILGNDGTPIANGITAAGAGQIKRARRNQTTPPEGTGPESTGDGDPPPGPVVVHRDNLVLLGK